MIVIVRLDLDRYDILTIARLYREGVITMGEAMQAKSYKGMSDVHALLWRRQVESLRHSAEVRGNASPEIAKAM